MKVCPLLCTDLSSKVQEMDSQEGLALRVITIKGAEPEESTFIDRGIGKIHSPQPGEPVPFIAAHCAPAEQHLTPQDGFITLAVPEEER